MIGAGFIQSVLNALGQVLAVFYSGVRHLGGYGVAIILLTLAIRVLLLPLGIKQIKSMQAMQVIQPKVKAIQQKYKGDRQRMNESMMALYKEYGVNPFSGCLPLLLQFPVLIALFAVLKVPGGVGHVPVQSDLHAAIVHQHTDFLGANLLCSAAQAGRDVAITFKKHQPQSERIDSPLRCGSGGASRAPYYFLAVAMIGTTFYQQRQMQKATPQGGNQQQQALTKIMPLLFGVWGFIFPAGLVVYWTTTNLVQIGQQHFMLPRMQGAEGGDRAATGEGKPQGKAPRRELSDGRARSTGKRPAGAGRVDGQGTARKRPPPSSSARRAQPGTAKPGPGKSSAGRGAVRSSGSGKGGGQPRSEGGGSGGANGGDRKKRRKR